MLSLTSSRRQNNSINSFTIYEKSIITAPFCIVDAERCCLIMLSMNKNYLYKCTFQILLLRADNGSCGDAINLACSRLEQNLRAGIQRTSGRDYIITEKYPFACNEMRTGNIKYAGNIPLAFGARKCVLGVILDLLDKDPIAQRDVKSLGNTPCEQLRLIIAAFVDISGVHRNAHYHIKGQIAVFAVDGRGHKQAEKVSRFGNVAELEPVNAVPDRLGVDERGDTPRKRICVVFAGAIENLPAASVAYRRLNIHHIVGAFAANALVRLQQRAAKRTSAREERVKRKFPNIFPSPHF